MNPKFVLGAIVGALLTAQPTPRHSVVNLATARWTRDSASTESVVLREDDRATEYLVRVPAGHVFRPHWHSMDERIVLLEGRLSIQQGEGAAALVDGRGYAFLPARDVQHTRCVSDSPCVFYVYWDGKLDFHAAQ